MAKIMDSARPGAVKRVLTRHNLNCQEFAQKAKLDRKTIQKINEGHPVKQETLKKVADALRVPVEHLKARTDDKALGDAEVQATPPWGNLLLKRLSSAELPELLQGTGRLHWMLELPSVAPKLHSTLEKIEDVVETLRVSLNDVKTCPDHTLRSHLTRIGKRAELENLLEELHAERIAVFGATYLFWEYSRDDPMRYEGREWGGADTYTSTQVAALCIDHSSLDSKRVVVDAGPKPPRYASEPTVDVFVDGVRVPRRLEELDDDLTF